MVCLESLQEFLQGRKAVRRCAKSTNGQFKTVHGFYLGMMGVRYNVGDNGGYRTLWPGQYAWMLNNGLVSWEDHKKWGLAKEDIEDKSKADGLVKLAALLQVIWFTLQSAIRAAHGLPLAPLETMTLAYVFNALVTYGFWWEKPKDIATASFVDLPAMTFSQREKFEGLAMENTYDVPERGHKQSNSIAWYVVPRDCRDDGVLVMAREEQEEMEQASHSTKGTSQLTVAQVGDASVITEWDASLYMSRYWPLLCLLGASFGAISAVMGLHFPLSCRAMPMANQRPCIRYHVCHLHAVPDDESQMGRTCDCYQGGQSFALSRKQGDHGCPDICRVASNGGRNVQDIPHRELLVSFYVGKRMSRRFVYSFNCPKEKNARNDAEINYEKRKEKEKGSHNKSKE
ncbi:hypothetical protein VTK56DRAFT_6251 [Thermocarpiscus australiensis]